jgi:hypothetical protein
MAEHLADLRQGCTLAEHLGRERVAQPMGGHTGRWPVRSQARATMRPTEHARMARTGASTVKNTARQCARGRPSRRYAATASPTSAGSGRRPLPPCRAPPARRPASRSRPARTQPPRTNAGPGTSSSKIAWSRSPAGCDRSQPAISAATWTAADVADNPASRHPATGGTAAARSAATKPSRRKNRSNDRRPVTRFLADPAVSRSHSLSKKAVTTPPDRPPMPVPSPVAGTRSDKNRLAIPTWPVTVAGARPLAPARWRS